MWPSLRGSNLDEMAPAKVKLASIYFFHGEEPFLAEERIEEIRKSFVAEEREGAFLRFSLDETGWAEIMESLRTGDLFHPGRKLVLVAVPEGKENSFEPEEERLWRDYLASPRPDVVLIVYYSGKIDRNSKLYQILKSIKSGQLKEEEFKIKKGRELEHWVRSYLEKQGKSLSSEALMALIDSAGNNLRILAREIEKLCLYRPQAKHIDLEDVVALCPSVRGFLEYELIESLEIGSPSRALQVLSKLLDEASKAEIIVGAITQFFKDLLLAREWLEQGQDERFVFNQLRPWIKESFGAFYELKKNQFLRAIFSLSEADLREAIDRLHSLDQAIKGGTSDREQPIFLAEFLFWYFERRKNKNSSQIS